MCFELWYGGRTENERSHLDVALKVLGSVTIGDNAEQGAYQSRCH